MPESPIDSDRYADLLARARPGIIEDGEEHDRLLGLAEELMEKGEELSAEEEKLLALLVFLIEAFESSIEEDEDDEEDAAAPPPAPHETLQRMMQGRGLALEDVAAIFGNPHLAREAVEGRRAISKGQAKQLGRFFQMPPKLFLP
ncbi:MAG TPA: transcriptional regulator [Solibacterales bacterium]|nr:transcriptional regulator [Bryobacterales bacterium]